MAILLAIAQKHSIMTNDDVTELVAHDKWANAFHGACQHYRTTYVYI